MATMIRHRELLSIGLSLLLLNCQTRQRSESKELVFRGKTMGTRYTVKALIPLTMEKVKKYKVEVEKILSEVNESMSTYQTNSEISRFNLFASDAWFEVSDELAIVTKSALKVFIASRGMYDPTVAPLVHLWGFGPQKKESNPPSLQEIIRAKANIGGDQIEVKIGEPCYLKKKKPELYLDLSSIAKGRGVDRVSKYLSQAGLTNHMVEIGGEVKTSGHNMNKTPWYIGIRVPTDKAVRLQTVLEISGKALATSGNYENYFRYQGKRYSHIIDPKTGFPVEHETASVSVLHESCMLADAYATALMAMGYKKGKRFAQKHGLEGLFIVADGKGGFMTKPIGKIEKRIKRLTPATREAH